MGTVGPPSCIYSSSITYASVWSFQRTRHRHLAEVGHCRTSSICPGMGNNTLKPKPTLSSSLLLRAEKRPTCSWHSPLFLHFFPIYHSSKTVRTYISGPKVRINSRINCLSLLFLSICGENKLTMVWVRHHNNHSFCAKCSPQNPPMKKCKSKQ